MKLSPRRGFRRGTNSTANQIEALEDRSLLTCDTFFSRGVLTVVGTNDADLVSVLDYGDGDVDITCDDSDTVSFEGVSRIVLRLLGGDDHLEYEFDGDITAKRDIQIDMGTGDDTVTFDSLFADILQNLTIGLKAGDGNDAIAVSLGDVQLQSRVSLGIDLGAGDDTADIDCVGTTTPNAGRSTSIIVRLQGGSGDDEVITELGTFIGGNLSFNAQMGAGNDVLDVVQEGHLEGRAKILVKADLGDGDDLFLGSVTANTLIERYSAFEVSVLGANGDDEIVERLDDVELYGRIRFKADGGQGDDQLSSFYRFEGSPSFDSTGLFSTTLKGGDGDDGLLVVEEFDESEAKLSFVLDGGRGTDVVVAPVGYVLRNFEFRGAPRETT